MVVDTFFVPITTETIFPFAVVALHNFSFSRAADDFLPSGLAFKVFLGGMGTAAGVLFVRVYY